MADQVERVPDAELEQLAKEGGPESAAAEVWRRLQSARARDRQFHAYRVGDYWIAGPTFDARAELMLLALAEMDEAQD